MSKEMRPSHRLDILCDALNHYCRKSCDHLGKLFIYHVYTYTYSSNIQYTYICMYLLLGKLLRQRMDKATEIQKNSKKALEELVNASAGMYTMFVVMHTYVHMYVYAYK